RRGRARSWVLMIAYSRALGFLRSRRRRSAWQAAPSTALSLLDGASAPRPTSDVRTGEADARRGTLRAALDALPVEQREVIELAFFEGLSHQDAADRSGQPLGTVKSRIRLGMQKLRSLLDASGLEVT
ncbi:MAG: sigma-70 family RNA polymerase sigma factor, partial [Gemmatimonadales bacterium]|nr:sigma-70 family RNA polymerase sigma factor [Gemmatimonadales bacterium]